MSTFLGEVHLPTILQSSHQTKYSKKFVNYLHELNMSVYPVQLPGNVGGDMEEQKNTMEEGAFVSSLKRNNRQIRDDRAASIAEDTELIYKRKIEDYELNLKKMKREQENMLDLSPTNSQSLILASDFNSTEYVEKDIELGIKIRNTEITLEIAKKRYNYLFGGK